SQNHQPPPNRLIHDGSYPTSYYRRVASASARYNAHMHRKNEPALASQPDTTFSLSDRAVRTADQPIGFLIATALANPHVISLAAGLVDYEALPSADTRALMAELLSDDAVGRARLNYGTTLGLPALRAALLGHLARLDGMTPEQFGPWADQIVVA